MRAAIKGWVRPVRSALSRARHGLLRQVRLRQLVQIPVPEASLLAEAISSAARGADRTVCEAIERERSRLLANHEPLIDGTLGPGNAFDSGNTVETACRVSRCPAGGLLLYHLARVLKPRHVIELGTNVGISSAYLGTALASCGGHLVTLEFSPYRRRLAQQMHQRLALRKIDYVLGSFADTLGPALANLPSVDLAFIDGDHYLQPTLEYFSAILARTFERAVIVFDDIRWSEGMKQAWDEVRRHPRVRLSINLHNIGLLVVSSSAQGDPSHHVGPIRV